MDLLVAAIGDPNEGDEMAYLYQNILDIHDDQNLNLKMKDIQKLATSVYRRTNADLHYVYNIPEYVRKSKSSRAKEFHKQMQTAFPSFANEQGFWYVAIAAFDTDAVQFLIECDKLRENLATFQQSLEQTHHKLQTLFEAHYIYMPINVCGFLAYRLKNLDRLMDEYAQQFEGQSKLFQHMQTINHLEKKESGINQIRKLFRSDEAYNQGYAEFLSTAKQTAKIKIEKECNGAKPKCGYGYLETFVTGLNKYGEHAFKVIHTNFVANGAKL